jgi:cytidine kinase
MLFSSNSQLPINSQPSAEIFRSSAWPLDAVADPTGAGDTFLGAMAGYLAAQGAPPYDSATLRQAIIQGSILASFTCEAFSTRRLESLAQDDLDQRLAAFRQATHW